MPGRVTAKDCNAIPGPMYDKVVWHVSAGLLWERLGRELTPEEMEEVADCIPSSSIFDALDAVMFEALGLTAETGEA